MKLALERVQADAQNAARDSKWPIMNAKVVCIISDVKSVWAFNNLESSASCFFPSPQQEGLLTSQTIWSRGTSVLC